MEVSPLRSTDLHAPRTKMTKKPNWTDPELPLTVKAAACFEEPRKRISLDVGAHIYRLRTNRSRMNPDKTGTSLVRTPKRDRGSPWWFREPTWSAIVRDAAQRRGDITKAGRVGL